MPAGPDRNRTVRNTYQATASIVGFRISLYTLYNVMRFEWDVAKNKANQSKHDGLDFETAARVFDDPNLLLLKDRTVDGEQRWHAIGAVLEAVLLVVHVYREETANGEETIRIISAREASKRERRVYLQQAAE